MEHRSNEGRRQRRQHTLESGDAVGQWPVRRPGRLVVEACDAGADSKLQSSGRKVVDGKGLACDEARWTQHRVGDEGTDANGRCRRYERRESYPPVEPDPSWLRVVSPWPGVIGNIDSVEAEQLCRSGPLDELGERSVHIDLSVTAEY